MSGLLDIEHCGWPSTALRFSIAGGGLRNSLSFRAEDSQEEPVAVGFCSQTAPCLNTELRFQGNLSSMSMWV